MACNQCVRVELSALAFGLGVGRSTLHGVFTAINYAIQCISVSSINFMGAYDVYQ